MCLEATQGGGSSPSSPVQYRARPVPAGERTRLRGLDRQISRLNRQLRTVCWATPWRTDLSQRIVEKRDKLDLQRKELRLRMKGYSVARARARRVGMAANGGRGR